MYTEEECKKIVPINEEYLLAAGVEFIMVIKIQDMSVITSIKQNRDYDITDVVRINNENEFALISFIHGIRFIRINPNNL